MSLLEVRDLRIAYPDDSAPAVRGVSFEIAAGEVVGLVGESGAGKSQISLATLGLLPANAQVSGDIVIDGTNVVGASRATVRQLRRNSVSMIFQDPSTALSPYVKVGVQLRRLFDDRGIGNPDKRRRLCVELLQRVRLPDAERLYHAYPHQLSGGMRQRVLIAAALVGEPALIVADEPTTALDVTVQARILRLLAELQPEFGTGMLLVTHDLGVIARMCRRVVVMKAGKVVEQGDCATVLQQPQSPHTRQLVAAVPRLDKPPAAPKETPATTLLQGTDIRVTFSDRRRASRHAVVAVESLSLALAEGEALSIVGESGSGKTSLARAIAGLVPCGGKFEFLGEVLAAQVGDRPKSQRRNLQMVFQDPQASLNPAMRIGQIVAEPIVVHGIGSAEQSLREQVGDALQRVGLSENLRERYPHELSGGQAQRVALARALITNPRLLICDEAFSALDGTVRRDVIALLQAERHRNNLSLIMITHDMGVVHEIGDRVMVMREGKVVEAASVADLFAAPQHEYTQSLLAAVPQLSTNVYPE